MDGHPLNTHEPQLCIIVKAATVSISFQEGNICLRGRVASFETELFCFRESSPTAQLEPPPPGTVLSMDNSVVSGWLEWYEYDVSLMLLLMVELLVV